MFYTKNKTCTGTFTYVSDVLGIKKANNKELHEEAEILLTFKSNAMPLQLHKNPLCWLHICHCPG